MKRVIVSSCLCLILFLGGCQMTKSYDFDEITEGNKIDVKKAKASGYVSLVEKEKLGYFTEDSSSNNRRYFKQAEKQKDELYPYVKELVEHGLNRKIEILGVRAAFPYVTVNVYFQTLDEPIVRDNIAVGLSDNGYFNEGETKNSGGDGFQEAVINGLYMMAYRKEVKAMQNYIETTYPQYQGFPEGKTATASMINPIISVKYASKGGNEGQDDLNDKERAEIFAEYIKQPKRTDAEWRVLFDQKKNLAHLLYVNLIEKDETKLPTEAEVDTILNDIKTNLLFKGFYSYGTLINTNLQDIQSNNSLDLQMKAWDPEDGFLGGSND